MNAADKKFSAKDVFRLMTLQVFNDFYEGSFEDFIRGAEGTLSEEEVLNELYDLLELHLFDGTGRRKR